MKKYKKSFRRMDANPDPSLHITESQSTKIKSMMDGIIKQREETYGFVSGCSKGEFYGKKWRAFYRHFEISSYKLLPKEKFDEAIIWLNTIEHK